MNLISFLESISILSLLTFVPFVGILIIIVLPTKQKKSYKYITLGICLIQLVLASLLYKAYTYQSLDVSLFKFTEKLNWINVTLGNLGKIQITYFLGVDGLNISLVLLSSIVFFIGVLASWKVQEKTKAYFSLYLLLSCTVMGSFLALDLFLFFLFFEFMLLPLYFLIGIWGGARRLYASIKFFIYTLLGSIFILLVIIGVAFSTTSQKTNNPSEIVHSFDISQLSYKKTQENYLPNSLLSPTNAVHLWDNENVKNHARIIAFWIILIGFLIKLPSVPFHTWLPDAHVEASTPISVILAGVLLKIGGYGILRIVYSIFPDIAQVFAFEVGLLGVISIMYGAMNALAMKDFKKMIAYSSVSHMGFVLLGISSLTAEGMQGSVFQMFSHGLLSSLLFILAGILYDRTHDRNIENYQGLSQKMPLYTVFVTLAFFASLGLPGFSGFIGEFFAIAGALASPLLPWWFALVAGIGIVTSAIYFLWTLQRVFFGKFWINHNLEKNTLPDLNVRELMMVLPLILLSLLIGIFPSLLFDSMRNMMDFFNF